MWLLGTTRKNLTRVFGPHLPARETVRDVLVLWGRRYTGFSASVFIALLPIVAFIFYMEYTNYPTSGIERSNWENLFVDLVEIATVILVVAFFAVYFLRTLYWFQKTLPKYWNRYTPPHIRADTTAKAEATDRSVEDIFDEAEWNAVKWFGYGVGFFAGILLGLLALEKVLNMTGLLPEFEEHIVQGVSEEGLLNSFMKMLGMLPLVGEVYNFTGELPGETTFERFLLNGTAVFFAVAVRNWAYMFEHIDYVYRNASETGAWQLLRYLFYLLFGAFACLFTFLLILVLVAAELAFV